MLKVNSQVGWQWGSGLATGTVIEMYSSRHVITTKGKTIARNGTEDDPAIVIQQESGTLGLKLAHEVQDLSS